MYTVNILYAESRAAITISIVSIYYKYEILIINAVAGIMFRDVSTPYFQLDMLVSVKKIPG